MNIINSIAVIVGIYLSIYVAYNYSIIALYFLSKEENIKIPNRYHSFLIIVPAHNEELFLSNNLISINQLDYPKDYFQTIVVADNCTDKTIEIATSHGMQVIERFSETEIGKGFAIRFAISEYYKKTSYDAIFIVDADSIVERSSLEELNKLLHNNSYAIQCYNGVQNFDSSWFTVLVNVSRTLSNEIIEPTKDKIGLTSHLMGNGMCFHRSIVDRFGWDSYSVGEDWEFFAKLINSGYKINFSKNAKVYHQESTTLKQATSQRIRWSSGRFSIIWQYGISIFIKGLFEFNFYKLESVSPLLFPNPSLGINCTIFIFLISLFEFIYYGKNSYILWFFCLIILQLAIFILGALKTKNKIESILSIFVAPLFLIWKLGIDLLSMFGSGRRKWKRTERL